MRNVLDGKRADGGTPVSAKGEALSQAAIDGARRRFLTMLDVPAGREPTPEETDRLIAGKTAKGAEVSATDYRRRVTKRMSRSSMPSFCSAPTSRSRPHGGLPRRKASAPR